MLGRDRNLYEICERGYILRSDYPYSIHNHIQDYLYSHQKNITQDTVSSSCKDLKLNIDNGFPAILDLYFEELTIKRYIKVIATNEKSSILNEIENARRIFTHLKNKNKNAMSEINLVCLTNHHNTIPKECNSLELTVLTPKKYLLSTHDDPRAVLKEIERCRGKYSRDIIIPPPDSCALEST